MHKLYWHCGQWRIRPKRSAPRQYKPLRDGAFTSWVRRGQPYNAAGGYYKRGREGR